MTKIEKEMEEIYQAFYEYTKNKVIHKVLELIDDRIIKLKKLSDNIPIIVHTKDVRGLIFKLITIKELIDLKKQIEEMFGI